MESFPARLVMKNSTSASSSQVWVALQIWHDKPHIINRRISGAVCIFSSKLNKNVSLNELFKLFNDTKIANSATDEEVKQIFSRMNIFENKDSEEVGTSLTLKRLLPRNDSHHGSMLEIAILDEEHCKATFFNLQQTQEQHTMFLRSSYTFQFVESDIQMIAHVRESDQNMIISWVMSHVFPKIQKWAEFATDQNIPSLSLVSVDRYVSLYRELKKKYGQHMVEIWPENTDPSKFVFEDVGIATYLLLLWERQRDEKGQPDFKQTFVDLGCGNGLLVHILTCEGHKGFGIDVRKRRIWDLYPSTTELKAGSSEVEDCFITKSWLLHLAAKVSGKSKEQWRWSAARKYNVASVRYK